MAVLYPGFYGVEFGAEEFAVLRAAGSEITPTDFINYKVCPESTIVY